MKIGKKYLKTLGFFFIMLMILPFSSECKAETNPDVMRNSSESAENSQATSSDVKTADSQCNYPFKPSNIIPVLFYYKEAMHFISFGEERCGERFRKEFENTVGDSWIVPDGCVEAILKDLKDAKENPEELRKRLDYY